MGALWAAMGVLKLLKEMLVFESDNHGVYVVFSNIYAEAGWWEGVRRLRKFDKRRKAEENTLV